jgi:hypothetical protein
VLATSLLGAAVLAALPGAGAGTSSPVDKFSGTCDAQVVLRMNPPMTGALRDTKLTIATRWATCTGTVTRGGKTYRVNRAHTVGRLHASGPTSCQLSYTAGGGHFTIAHRWRIDFTHVEPRATLVGELVYSGVAGGKAFDSARLAKNESLADVFARCRGAGVGSLLIDVTIVTAPYIAG